MKHCLQTLHIPDALIILGSDAAGKNHVANVLADILTGAGHEVEKREGWFSRRATDATTSENKSRLDLLVEKLFLSSVPVTRHVMFPVLGALIAWDLKHFKPSDKTIILISHTPVRVLSFFLGHRHKSGDRIFVPPYMDSLLKKIQPVTGAKTIVLDIDDRTRKKRFAKRREKGRIDQFDRYMAKDGDLSERIEDVMIFLAENYLDARKIENNDHGETRLVRRIAKALASFDTQPPGDRKNRDLRG